MTDEKTIYIEKKAHELDELFCSEASIDQIEHFFQSNQADLHSIFLKIICRNYLTFPDIIAGLNKQYVREICRFFSKRYRTAEYSSYMLALGPIIMSRRISAERRAMFWNAMTALRWPWTGLPDRVFAQDVFIDNDDARRCFSYHGEQGPKHDFIRHTALDARGFIPADEVRRAIDNDYVSVFEMGRQLRGKEISVTMLVFLLLHNAVKCFLHLLAHFPKKVYKCRSPEEWLFTVCRCCPQQTAIPIIRSIEEDRPGIVANARDPWGNNLLWNTLPNMCGSYIQEELLSLSCDPDAENQWGLSYRLVQENKL